MITTRSKPRLRHLKLNKARPSSTRPVQHLLLDLAYNLHATRVVRVLPAEPRTAVQG
mgnify:CR=1 FL=1